MEWQVHRSHQIVPTVLLEQYFAERCDEGDRIQKREDIYVRILQSSRDQGSRNFDIDHRRISRRTYLDLDIFSRHVPEMNESSEVLPKDMNWSCVCFE